MHSQLELMFDQLLWTRDPPSFKTAYTYAAIYPELKALLQRVDDEAIERHLDMLELVHVHGWILDRVAMNLKFLDNKTLARIFEVHLNAIKDRKHPFWSARQKAVEKLYRELREDREAE